MLSRAEHLVIHKRKADPLALWGSGPARDAIRGIPNAPEASGGARPWAGQSDPGRDTKRQKRAPRDCEGASTPRTAQRRARSARRWPARTTPPPARAAWSPRARRVRPAIAKHSISAATTATPSARGAGVISQLQTRNATRGGSAPPIIREPPRAWAISPFTSFAKSRRAVESSLREQCPKAGAHAVPGGCPVECEPRRCRGPRPRTIDCGQRHRAVRTGCDRHVLAADTQQLFLQECH